MLKSASNMILASISGHIEVVRLFLKQVPNLITNESFKKILNERNINGMTPFLLGNLN